MAEQITEQMAAKILEGSHDQYNLPEKLVKEYELWKEKNPSLFLRRVAATVRAARKAMGVFITLTGYSGWRQGSLRVRITSITTEGFTLEWFDQSDQLTSAVVPGWVLRVRFADSSPNAESTEKIRASEYLSKKEREAWAAMAKETQYKWVAAAVTLAAMGITPEQAVMLASARPERPAQPDDQPA